MPAVRLPQSIQEIRAAAKVIVNDAYPENGPMLPTKMFKSYDTDKKLVAGWLGTIAPLGAIMYPDLVTQSELCLSASTEQLQSLRPSRVATLIARRSWQRID